MKLNTGVRFCLVGALLVGGLQGTTCGAELLGIKPPAAPANVKNTPELVAADERVSQAEAQLEVAKKQLVAARSLLKAAEADLRAARADREALALKVQAQSLADEAGMIRATTPPPALAAVPKAEPEETMTAPAATTAPATTPPATQSQQTMPQATAPAENTAAPADVPNTRIQQLDFAAEPMPENNANAEQGAPPPVQLR